MKRVLGLTVIVLLAMPAIAQDSVGTGGLPGDALSPYSTANQCFEYDITMTPFQASWGTEFAICPLIKASKGDPNYFNNFLSAQSLSRLQFFGDGSNQFAATAAEFGGNYNGVLGGIVTYDLSNPLALHVKRVVAASNGTNNTENFADLGIGTVDEYGNVCFRSDTGQYTPNNIFLVDMAARNCGVLNVIGGTLDAPATNQIVTNHASVHTTPNIGPAGLFGSAHYLGANFDGNYGYGITNPPTYTSAHLDPNVTSTRGNMAYMTQSHPCLGGTHGTGALLAYVETSAACDTFNLWGINAGGAVALTPGPKALTLPATITDYADSVTKTVGGAGFDHYHSQVAFRGGNAQIGMNVDQQGRLLAAAVVYEPSVFNNNPVNYIAAARMDAFDCVPEWSIVAYSRADYSVPAPGKAILDGPGGNQIGFLTTMDNVTGGTPFGPSISAPMIDSVGNVWFISAVGLDKLDPNEVPFIDYDSALIRAVYDPDADGLGNPGWELELVLELGDVFEGLNSGKYWQIQFMGIADSDSVDSGGAWSSNIAEKAFLGVDPVGLEPADALSLGGLVVNIDIVYDVDEDFDFDDPTSSGGDPNSLDESYRVLAYVSAAVPPQVWDPGDMNCDGVVNNGDIDPFVLALNSQPDYELAYPDCDFNNGDINGDGFVNNGDIDPFVTLLSS